MNNKIILSLSFLFFIFLTIFSLHIPFFWDGIFFSKVASNYFDGLFTLLDFPTDSDNVTFPLYSTYLFVIWKLFSKSLFVSHLSMLPFLIGICYEFYKLSKKYLSDYFVSLALILLLLQPTFLTQSILMSYDIIALYLFLLLINLLIEEKTKSYTVLLPILGLYSIRGIILVVALLVIHLIKKNRQEKIIAIISQYALCIFLLLAWMCYHYLKTGWLMISPTHENTDEYLVSATMMIRQFFYIIWKLVDFGQIILWLFLIFSSIYLYRKNKLDKKFKTILVLVFIPIVVTAMVMIPLSNPISQRYFLFAFVLLIIPVCYLLQQFQQKKIVIIFMFLFSISLIAGNFWIYPERFGNGWDASLKVLPYFSLKEKMDDFIQQNKIDKNKIGTQFPLTTNKKYSYLTDENSHYDDVENQPEKFNYFLQSNIVNTGISAEIETIKQNWILVKQFKYGQVYISLYKNPKFILTTSK